MTNSATFESPHLSLYKTATLAFQTADKYSDDVNWWDWKDQILGLFKLLKLKGVLDGSIPRPTAFDVDAYRATLTGKSSATETVVQKVKAAQERAMDEWDGLDMNCQLLLRQVVTGAHRRHFSSARTSNAMWEKLVHAREPAGTETDRIWKELLNSKATEGNTLDGILDHVSHLENLKNQLHRLGGQIEDQQFAMLVINSLPPSWDIDPRQIVTSAGALSVVIFEIDRRHRKNRDGEVEVANLAAVPHNRGRRTLLAAKEMCSKCGVFIRPFAPELLGQIVLFLPCDDLKSYSLASRAFNREANRILWRAIMVSPHKEGLGGMEAFAQALRRNPVRATNIFHISFTCIPEAALLPSFPYTLGASTMYPRLPGIFPKQPTEQFWASLEEALRLTTCAKSIALLVPDKSFYSHWSKTPFPDRFIDILTTVFKASRIANLHAHLSCYQLFQLCRALPSLTTLRARSFSRNLKDTLLDLPSDALPLLRHLESDLPLLCHIAPYRPIETCCIVGGPYWIGDLKLLTAAIQSCETLQIIQVECAADIGDAARCLPALAHGTLRNLHLSICLDGDLSDHDEELNSSRLTPPTVMLGLPLGALALFPKLEVLQITLEHDEFSIVEHGMDGEDQHFVAKALAAFLTSEDHATLCQVEVGCSSVPQDDHTAGGVLRFLGTRCDGHWDIKIGFTKGPPPTSTPQS
jgi:hypothetical protein